MIDDLSTLIVQAFKAAIRGGRMQRLIFFGGFGLVFCAITLAAITDAYHLQQRWIPPLTAIIAVVGALAVLGLGGYYNAVTSAAREKLIEDAEERARKSPAEPQAAWDLARVKLESYLNRNLKQVQWIFFLTLLMMVAGFVVIGYGVLHVYQAPEAFKPSIVVTVSGLITEFIAATFLFVYRSTMEQAKSYVTMLEKINAVGMSMQILDRIESGEVDKERARLAMELLSLYGQSNKK